MTERLARPRHPKVMPKGHPRIAHFMPYLFGDTLAAVRRAKRLGFKYIDQNGNCDSDGEVWIIHWGDLRDYQWEFTGKYETVDGKRREVRRFVGKKKISTVTSAKMERRRSKKVGGRRPHRAIEHMREAKKYGVILCLEAKNSKAFLDAGTWRLLALDAVSTGATVVVMTLDNLYRGGHPMDPWTRLELASKVGFAVAVLPRRAKPKGFASYQKRTGVKVWGRWR